MIFKSMKKTGKKCCRLCCRMACITRNFFKTQNSRLINESGFKSRETYNGTHKVSGSIMFVLISNFTQPLVIRCFSLTQDSQSESSDSSQFHRKIRPSKAFSTSELAGTSFCGCSYCLKLMLTKQKTKIVRKKILMTATLHHT